MKNNLIKFLKKTEDDEKIRKELDKMLYNKFDTEKVIKKIQEYAKTKGFDFTIEEIKQIDGASEDFSDKQKAFVKAIAHDCDYSKFLQMNIDYDTLEECIVTMATKIGIIIEKINYEDLDKLKTKLICKK